MKTLETPKGKTEKAQSLFWRYLMSFTQLENQRQVKHRNVWHGCNVLTANDWHFKIENWITHEKGQCDRTWGWYQKQFMSAGGSFQQKDGHNPERNHGLIWSMLIDRDDIKKGIYTDFLKNKTHQTDGKLHMLATQHGTYCTKFTIITCSYFDNC